MNRNICLVGLLCGLFATGGDIRNVLFIGVDDLRPELGCYGKSYMHTPNIDRLAQRGIQFDTAVCQVAVCGASRVSMLSGLRPQQTDAWSYQERLDERRPGVISLPAYLKKNGWQTYSYGKIYHTRHDDAKAWTEPAWHASQSYPKERRYYEAMGYFQKASWQALDTEEVVKGKGKKGPSTENGGDTPEANYPDVRVANKAIETMRANKDNPFFIAVGFRKPHLPFNAPAKYWDLYDRSKIEVPKDTLPEGSPVYAQSTWRELVAYTDVSKDWSKLDDAKTKELIHGYRACVSMIDAQVGRLLAEVDKLGLRKNTLIVFWADHGYYLGDFGDWCKHSNYEVAARVPMIIRGANLPSGKTTKCPAELVDLYPTICSQLGLKTPDHCDGSDLGPELRSPGSHSRGGAFSQYKKYKKKAGRVLGTSIRTERYRFTAWHLEKDGTLQDVELYDLKRDPNAEKSVAAIPEYKPIVSDLLAKSQQSKTGFPLVKKATTDK